MTSKILLLAAVGAFIFVGNAVPAMAGHTGDPGEPGNAGNGKAVYGETCVFCHGKKGKGGIPGVPDLTRKKGPLAKTDAELFRNISDGFESPGSAMAMPARGGNPDLTESEIHDVVAYLREAFQKR